jgi:hypothetical protein
MNDRVHFIDRHNDLDYISYSTYIGPSLKHVPVKVTMKNGDVLKGYIGGWVDELDNDEFDAYEFRPLGSGKNDYHDIPDADVIQVEVI